MTAVYNQRFYDVHSQNAPLPLHDHAISSMAVQCNPNDFAADRRRQFRHDRSDSDTSHSSFGIGRLQQHEAIVDGQTPAVAFYAGNGGSGGRSRGQQGFYHHKGDQGSDSQSSQGSLRGLATMESLSSHGSLRYAGYHDGGGSGGAEISPHDSLSSHSSPRHTAADSDQGSYHRQQQRVQPAAYPQQQQLDLLDSERHTAAATQSANSTPMARIRTRRNSEPDYANLPIITQLRGERPTIVGGGGYDGSKVGQTFPGAEKISGILAASDELRSGGESLHSADSLSPTDFMMMPPAKRQDTPSSVRSASTQNSTSYTSEGQSQNWLVETY